MIRIHAQNGYGRQRVDLTVLRDNLHERPITVDALQWDVMSGDLAFQQIDEGSYPPAPTFQIEDAAAQRLMDDLYRAGFRPTDARGSVGQLEAVQEHLRDMRRAYDVVLAGAR